MTAQGNALGIGTKLIRALKGRNRRLLRPFRACCTNIFNSQGGALGCYLPPRWGSSRFHREGKDPGWIRMSETGATGATASERVKYPRLARKFHTLPCVVPTPCRHPEVVAPDFNRRRQSETGATSATASERVRFPGYPAFLTSVAMRRRSGRRSSPLTDESALACGSGAQLWFTCRTQRRRVAPSTREPSRRFALPRPK
jgi:hypothetical protein